MNMHQSKSQNMYCNADKTEGWNNSQYSGIGVLKRQNYIKINIGIYKGPARKKW